MRFYKHKPIRSNQFCIYVTRTRSPLLVTAANVPNMHSIHFCLFGVLIYKVLLPELKIEALVYLIKAKHVH